MVVCWISISKVISLVDTDDSDDEDDDMACDDIEDESMGLEGRIFILNLIFN